MAGIEICPRHPGVWRPGVERDGGWSESRGGAAGSFHGRETGLDADPFRSQSRQFDGLPGGITVLDESGQLLPAAEEILQILSGSGCILGTGHLSQQETFALIDRANELGGIQVLVTHPEWPPTFLSVDQQKTLARRGNVMFERCFVSTTHRCGFVPFETIEQAIAETGVENTVLSTDLGQPDTPPPVEGLRAYADRLRSTGFSVDDIRRMIQTNPARLLNQSSTRGTTDNTSG